MTRIEQNAPARRQQVTPELVDHYVREGRRLRARTLRRIGRQVWASMGRAGPGRRLWTVVAERVGGRRRMGRLTTRAVR